MNRYEINCERDLGSVRPLSDAEKNAKDENVKCPRCLEYNLPKYYPGALGYWYSVRDCEYNSYGRHGRPVLDIELFRYPKQLSNYLSYPLIKVVSNYNDELCSECGDNEAGQARMEQSNMSTEELGMLRDWLIVSKEDTS